ncbi:MAG: hypothetical protein Nkreftii_001382 [Candidatus Nitrospira kreftii]|uniref:Asparagine synthetase domain-containing protein n=1 Tax=Candidatus Nitrospira kreftii TaxID=2652173 RepID=A0A7S8FD21_9BACT|nr:MAG: hypothetical protein Nkreftii_001382 [Candidatus Nitrospira kreftii]
MELNALTSSTLPKLAWVADVDCQEEAVVLFHGSSVEVCANFFIEGVWNGPFQFGEFGNSDCVFGTGGVLDSNSICFVPSASTVDSLYYDEEGTHIIVSNSLPLLLGYVGDSLDLRCQEYPEICNSIMLGINHYRRDIPTRKGKVQRQLYRNLKVSREGVVETEKPMPPRFGSFEEYRGYLRDNYARIVANARDPSRAEPLGVVSTQSTGYDTTAVNALARVFGIDKVFTVTKAKSIGRLAHQDEGGAPDDDGTQICNTLGLPCTPIDRRAFTHEFESEYLFYSALYHNQDANMLEIGEHISKTSVLLTGHGGAIWYPQASRSELLGEELPSSELNTTDSGGLGMTEWRLRVGFIHLPLPHIGARRKQDILDITESSEMDAWRLRKPYDRPIARRMAEEEGVSRQLFGQYKKGSVVIFPQPAIPYGKALRDEFFQCLVDMRILAKPTIWLWPFVRWVNSVLMMKSQRHYAPVYYTERLISKLIGRDFNFRPMWWKLRGTLYCVCVKKAATKYAECLPVDQSVKCTGKSKLKGSQR